MSWWKRRFQPAALEEIPGILQDEADSLRKAGVPDADAFQKKLDNGSVAILQDLRKKTDLDLERILELQANFLKVTSARVERSWFKRHLWDLIALGLVFLFLFGITWPWVIPIQPRVVAAVEIPATTVLNPSMLQVDHAASRQEAESLLARFEGKYTPARIRKGDSIPEAVARNGTVNLAGLTIVKMQAKNVSQLEGRSFPLEVTLIFSSRKTSAGAILPGLLFDVESRSSTVTVALSGLNAKEAAQWLGSSDLYLGLNSP